ncbi:IclR family transcriptional regulator [Marinobacterium rhizophilum]|uniref:HTH-type transcriptional repressor AllR n=1 Tax=Marinobacterium rhizophilum TaxID=420402 RepID=A0ABY5HLH2_9GAMM|nr:IclR family transcriptional regulator C-terminal domain-containing protein [Marinobacterium rhizophilum]UTW13231.1 helix-turn-helix domain-containing protein [Marinobacterium rhizophilum]
MNDSLKSGPKTGKKTSAASAVQVQSLSRALLLLKRIAASDNGLNLTELAGELALAPSTAHRLLNSMRQLDFVDFDEQTGLWSVGVTAFSVGSAYLKKRDFVAEARTHMKRLVAQTGETSNLAILDGYNHVFVGQVECNEVMRMVVQIGSRGTLHAAGVGKALLAGLGDSDVTRIINHTGLAALTQNTITSPDAFMAELDRIRLQGFAVDDEEQVSGLRCIAANIYDENAEVIAAVSISGPSVRVSTDQLDHYSTAVMAAADAITRAIGGSRPTSGAPA